MNGEEWRPQLNKNLHSRVYQPKFIARQSNFHRNLQKKPNLAAVKEEKELDWLGICLVLSFTLLIQAILAVGSYSGEGMKPLNGDFEAQRHWLEITFNLPIYQWYVNGTENDLLYWGLDYPPLTAYHSWLMGFLANKIDSSWIELHSSRGIETGPSKMFMRLTAILPFYLIYLPVVFAFTCLAKSNKISQTNLFAAFFAYGGLLVVDCAHFQYNSVSLGFFIGSYVALTSGFVRLGSILFCLAVNYKQMELYHALPIFVFILARTTKRPLFSRIPETVKGLLPIALVVLYTFAAIWSPFLLQGRDAVQAVLSRIFPFSRGLYEDKVASVWCALSPVLKLNRLLEHATLLKLCTGCVLVSSLPSLLILFARPTAKNFRLALFLTSLSFFLFSFQVHEKSILLSAIAALLLLPDFPAELAWFLHLANTSLFSLCMKDGTQLTLLYFVAYSIFCHAALPGLESKPFYLLKHVSCLGSIAICLAEWFLVPPVHLPHIFPLLNAFYSCSHFVAFLLYFYAQMFREEYQKWTKKSS